MASRHLSRAGKRLRPPLVLLFADACGVRLSRTYAAAAAIEVYHPATLIYDDIQDNAEFRRGLPCPHVTSSTSMAMNLAGTIRSLMYHILHRASDLTQAEQVEIHHQIDEAATKVSPGQSIDTGRHEQWYTGHQDYPYEQMIRWKSAALFGCSAAVGALLAGVDSETVALTESIGTNLGVLFQKMDD
jgi:geranylgeranyl diphosphate synthase type I